MLYNTFVTLTSLTGSCLNSTLYRAKLTSYLQHFLSLSLGVSSVDSPVLVENPLGVCPFNNGDSNLASNDSRCSNTELFATRDFWPKLANKRNTLQKYKEGTFCHELFVF